MSEHEETVPPLFPPTKARADHRPGALYAVSGEGGWIYYGQHIPNGGIAFFRRRDRALAEVSEILASPILSRVTVTLPSIGRALRFGAWTKLGLHPLPPAAAEPQTHVNWPVATLEVKVWSDGGPEFSTRVEDPAIQQFEIMAAWDAVYHIPERLTADFGAKPAAWHVGGPVWRQRRVMEERAARSPDAPWDQLPPDWVPTAR